MYTQVTYTKNVLSVNTLSWNCNLGLYRKNCVVHYSKKYRKGTESWAILTTNADQKLLQSIAYYWMHMKMLNKANFILASSGSVNILW